MDKCELNIANDNGKAVCDMSGEIIGSDDCTDDVGSTDDEVVI